MAAIVVVTILAAGLLGGTVSILTGARAGRSSMWGGMAVALVMLAGWTLGTRVRDRKKLDLPLWHRLTEEQAATLKQYHQWSRTGRIEQDDDAKRTSAGRSGHRESRRTGTGASGAAPSRGSSSEWEHRAAHSGNCFCPPSPTTPLRLAAQSLGFTDPDWTKSSSIRKVFLRRPASHVE